MQISCEKCSTTYALDDRLIPPGGAPVQCTHCGHVFTAKAGAEPLGGGTAPRPTERFGQPTSISGTTQMFGRVTAPAPELPDEGLRSKTLVFGRAPAAAPNLSPPASGSRAPQGVGSGDPADAPGFLPDSPVREKTRIFGGTAQPPGMQRSARPSPPAAAGPSAPSAPSASVSPSAAAAPRQSSTQLFGVADLEAAVSRPRAQEPASPFPQAARTTQVFGVAAAGAAPSPPPQPRGGPRLTPGQGVPAGQATTSYSTQMFGTADLQAVLARGTDPAAPAPAEKPAPQGLEPAPPAAAEPDPYPEDELEQDEPPFDEEPLSMQAPLPPSQGAARAGAPAARHAPISLPPEGPPPMTLPSDLGTAERDAEPDAELLLNVEPAGKRTGLFTVLGVALAVAAFFGYRILLDRNAVPQEALVATESALSLLRRDDGASQEKAIEQLMRVSQTWPQLLEARADLLLAVAVRSDDVRLTMKRIQLEAEVLNRRLVKLQEEKAPNDWQNRVSAMVEERQGLLKQVDPLNQRAKELDARATQLSGGLPSAEVELSPRDELAVLRAQAVYEGTKGTAQALILSERYRGKVARDGWDAIAFAEYALNARVPPATLSEARSRLDGLIAQDSAFLRAYVLAARLSVLEQRFDLAANALEATMALNPAHELAPKLLSWVHQAERAEAAGR